MLSYRNKSEITIDTVTPDQILQDYLYTIASSSAKVTKRIHRMSFICNLTGTDINTLLSQIKIPVEKSHSITLDQLREFFSESHKIIPGKREIKDIEPVDPVKREIEELLTKRLNMDDNIYNITCKYTSELVRQLKNHRIFGPLMTNKSIIFLHKGSMAHKRILTHFYPEKKSEIEELFGNGGDNDCIIMIDPKLPTFDRIRHMIIEYVHQFLLENVPYISTGIVNSYANSINSIELGGETLQVSPCERNHFTIKKENGKFYRYTDKNHDKVYVSRNDTLNFIDEADNPAVFALLRYKKAFKVYYKGVYKIIGAEILDISIPDKEEYPIVAHYDEYKIPDKWTTTITV